jgi:hypothetical protein
VSISVVTTLYCDGPESTTYRVGYCTHRAKLSVETEGNVPGTISTLRQQAREAYWRSPLRMMADGETRYRVDVCPRCQREMSVGGAQQLQEEK